MRIFKRLVLILATWALVASGAEADRATEKELAGGRGSYQIKQTQTGKDRLVVTDANFPAKGSEEQRQRYIEEVIFPKVEADAAAGEQPALWEIAFFYLNGWGTPVDLGKAEVAVRAGLAHQQGHGAWRLGCVYFEAAGSHGKMIAEAESDLAMAEELIRGALEVGFTRAAPQASYVARAYLGRWWGVKPDLKKAEALLEATGEVAPEDPRYLLTLGVLYNVQGRKPEAYEAMKKAAVGLRKKSVGERWEEDYAYAARTQCRLASDLNRVPELEADELHVFIESGSAQGFGRHPEALLQAIAKVAPEHPNYLLAIGEWHWSQHRSAEAYDFLSRVLPHLKEQEGAEEFGSEYNRIKGLVFLAGAASSKLNSLTPDQLMELMPKFPPIFGWLVVLGLVLMLGVLLLWTWLTRARGPGLFLSLTWGSVALLGAGLGIFVSLPGLDKQLAMWSGAIVIAFTGLLAVLCVGWSRYFGNGPLFLSWGASLKTFAILCLLLVGVQVILGGGYSWLYERVVGEKLESQLAAAMLGAHSPWQLAVSLAVGALAIPFYEELIFRGFLFDSVGRRWGNRWAIGVSAVLFGLAHGIQLAPVLIGFGLALGWLRLRAGSLRQCILLHCLNNGLAVLALYWGKA